MIQKVNSITRYNWKTKNCVSEQQYQTKAISRSLAAKWYHIKFFFFNFVKCCIISCSKSDQSIKRSLKNESRVLVLITRLLELDNLDIYIFQLCDFNAYCLMILYGLRLEARATRDTARVLRMWYQENHNLNSQYHGIAMLHTLYHSA